MQIIEGPPKSGKTTKLILISYDTGCQMVVRNKREAGRVMLQAHDLGVAIKEPLTYSEFIDNAYFGQKVTGVLIDDPVALLNQMTGGRAPVKAITLTKNHAHNE